MKASFKKYLPIITSSQLMAVGLRIKVYSGTSLNIIRTLFLFSKDLVVFVLAPIKQVIFLQIIQMIYLHQRCAFNLPDSLAFFLSLQSFLNCIFKFFTPSSSNIWSASVKNVLSLSLFLYPWCSHEKPTDHGLKYSGLVNVHRRTQLKPVFQIHFLSAFEEPPCN